MAQSARLIIPVWGERYVNKVLSVTLPAVLAPGNLPALSRMFDVELVLVTESRLFDLVRGSPSFQAAARICTVRLVPLDDLISNVYGDYGMVLTYALFRGFADLGARMTEVFLLLLNADFIICNNSLRQVGQLMSEGKRVILAPSFRVVLEDVWPRLADSVDAESGALSVSSRELVRLALANKHPTVQARTINQRLRHLVWMDQYYWYVDDDTMIGYQSPMALVAIRPQRVVTEPSTFWDYGFIPDAAPTATATYIGDSDDFFMIELQSRDAGREMMRIGWLSLDELARTEAARATKEHRESSKQLLVVHAGDLPSDLQAFIDQSRVFMGAFERRLPSTPAPHIGHPVLGQWFEDTRGRQRGARASMSSAQIGHELSGAPGMTVVPRGRKSAAGVLRMLKVIYGNTFGLPPQVTKFHPFWAENSPVSAKIAAWRNEGRPNILWISSGDTVFRRLLSNRVDPAALLAPHIRVALLEQAPYDACLCQLTLTELEDLNRLYAAIRPLIRENGQIIVAVMKEKNVFEGAEFPLAHADYPDVDVSAIHFHGTAMTGILRALYMRAARVFVDRPIARGIITGGALFLLAPFVRAANACARRRDSAVFSPMWTSLTIEFTVKRRTP